MEETRTEFDVGPWLLVCSLGVMIAIWRGWSGLVPYDISSYIAAAQTFAAGLDPYGAAIFDAPSYDGYVYVYPPHTLWLLTPLTWLEPRWFAAMDALARFGALAWIVVWLSRRLGLRVPTHYVLLGVVGLYVPVTLEFINGNISVYLAAAILVALSSLERARTWKTMGALAMATLVLSVKFTWLLPVGVYAVLRRDVRGVAVMGSVMSVVGAVNVAMWGESMSWLSRGAELRAQMPDASLFEVHPALGGAAALLWSGAMIALLRRGSRSAWVFVGTSVVWWPRLGLGVYVALLPALFYLVSRDRRWGILCAPMLSVFGLLAMQNELLGMYEQMALVWSLGVGVATWWECSRDLSDRGRGEKIAEVTR